MKKLTLLLISLTTILFLFSSTNKITEVIALDYYSGINTSDSYSEFSSELTSLITTTHNYKSYGSGYNSPLAQGAAVTTGSSSMTLFYTGYIDSASNSGGNTTNWNKEHVWPKSLAGGESSAPANDIHNIRPTNAQINSRRGNLPFSEDFTTTIAYGAVSYAQDSTYCYYNSSYFEPRDEVKGDCARIIFYLLTRYTYLDSDVVGDFDMFIRWHYDDPVDEYEINMNQALYEYQGNRNPYIDHPEYVDKMFPNEYGVSFEELETILLPSEVSSNIELPSKAGDYNITWTSNNSAITNAGVVTQGNFDTKVTLTASITKEGTTGVKQFEIIVKARELSLVESFIYAPMKNSLSIEYTSSNSEQVVTTTSGVIDNTNASGNFLNLVKGTNYAEEFGLNHEDIFLTLEDPGTGNGVSFYKNETLTMNNYSIVKISSLKSEIQSIKLTYSDSYDGVYLSSTTTGGTQLIDSVATNIDAIDVYLIQGNSQARISAIEITYKSNANSYDVSNIDFNFGFEITQENYNQLSQASDFEMGMLYVNASDINGNIDDLYNNESINSFISNNNLTKSDLLKSTSNNNYIFSINVDVENNNNIKACGYMVYNNQVYFTETLNRSIEDVINIYVNEYSNDPIVLQYIDLLKYLIK